jgi:chromosome segregation ATPase
VRVFLAPRSSFSLRQIEVKLSTLEREYVIAVHKHTEENKALERELDAARKSIKDHRRLHQQLESDLAASQQAQFDLISQVDSLEQALRELKHSTGAWCL